MGLVNAPACFAFAQILERERLSRSFADCQDTEHESERPECNTTIRVNRLRPKVSVPAGTRSTSDRGDLRMELTEALVSDSNDEIIEITLTGDEDEWREIAAVLKESDSDLATELGLKIREALRTAGQ